MKKHFLSISFFCILFTLSAFPQISRNIISVKTGEAKEKESLSFSVDLLQTTEINKISIFYKNFGQSEYKRKEMMLSGNNALGSIPPEDVTPPYLEYYILAELINGTVETYPVGAPDQANATQIQVKAVMTSKKDSEVLILSPEPGENVDLEQFYISFSFFNASDAVDKKATKLFINDRDVSSSLLFTEYAATYYPDSLLLKNFIGVHTIKIELYDNNKSLYYTKTLSFTITPAGQEQITAREFKYNISIQGETRSETFNAQNTLYNRGYFNFNSSYSDWTLTGNVYLTSEERDYLQPQHRYSFLLESDWLHLGVGDNYPRMPSLIMDGKRVRGFSGNLTLGIFNLQAVYGQVTRNVEGKLLQVYGKNDLVPFGNDIIDYQDSLKARIVQGTFKRNIFAVRPYFGKGENFQFGLSYLHSIDDVSSVQFAAKPKENLLVGTDLMLGFDNQRVLFTTQAALSLINEDISTGTFDDKLIDSLFGEGKQLGGNPADIKKLRDLASKFITINQFIKPFNIEKFSTLASEAALSLNYFNNYFKVSYIYRGNDFQSFGQSYLRTDVSGFNFMDRIRLLDNHLFVSAGFESLNDNLQKTKFATTNYKNINTSVTYYPEINIPRITLGYGRYSSSNDININSPDSTLRKLAVDDITNRYSTQFSYDFEYQIKHQSSLGFVYSKRDDQSIYRNNSNTFSAIFMVSSTWKLPLLTSFSISINRSATQNLDFNYTSINAGGRYQMLEGQLELSALINPNFGDYKRIIFNAGAKYYILKNLNVVFDAKYFKNASPLSSDTIFSLMTRYDM